jgi:flagellin-like protein
MKKGISTIVATILMLMIVIALAGAAYLYISGVFTSRISTAFEIVFADASTIGIRNIGTENITQLNVFVDGEEVSIEKMSPIEPGTMGLVNITTLITKGTHSFTVKSSSMVQRFPVTVSESITDMSICQDAETNGFCDGLDIIYGEGYKDDCCKEYTLCC